jgi:hypothetical protein
VNTRRQGAIGLARAIAYYTNKGYAVFIPVTDVSRYDLLVDTGVRILRVEVKTTRQADGSVTLRTTGGNQSWSGVVKRISSEDCDVVFIVNLLTGAEQEFESHDLEGRSSVTVRHATLDFGVSGESIL